MLAAFTWTAGGNGNYNTAADWTGPNNVHAVPSATDDATVPSGITVTVTANTTVNSFSGSLNVSSGAFNVANSVNIPNSYIYDLTVGSGASFTASAETTYLYNTATISGNLNVPSGATLIFNNTGNGANLLSGATLTGPGSFVVASSLFVDAAITAPTNLLLNSVNADGIDGPGTLTVPSGATLDWRSGQMNGVGGATDIAPGATLLLEGTSDLELGDRSLVNAGTATYSTTGNLSFSHGAVFTNSGTLAITSDTNFDGVGVLTNTGTLTKTSPTGIGVTNLLVTYNNSGTTIGQSGNFMIVEGGIDNGVFNVPGPAGTIDVTGEGYDLNSGATFTGPGTLELNVSPNGGTPVYLNTNISVPNLSITNGYIGGSGTLTVPGTLTLDNAYIANAALNLPTGSTLSIFGAGHTTTFNNVTVNQSGMATLSGTDSFSLAGSAIYNNAGTFTIQNDTVNGTGTFYLNNATFNNTGTLIKTTTSGPSGLTDIAAATFYNRGKVSAVSGTLQLDVNGTSTGTIDASSGATLLLTNTWALNAGTAFTGTGLFANGNANTDTGTITVNANVAATNFSITGGNVVVTPAATTFTVTNLTFSAGQFTGPGTLAVPSAGTAAISTSTDKNLSGGTLSIAGLANWTGTGNIDLTSGAVLFVQAGGILNASNDQTINGTSHEVVNDSGTILKSSITGVGTTTILAQTNILNGGAITLNSGNLSTSSLVDVGTISLASQTILNVSGTYTQPNAGTLNIAVGGGPLTALFGQLKVTTSASINGTLNATLVNGYVPTFLNLFPIVAVPSLTGNFTTYNGPTNGIVALLSYSAASNGVNLIDTFQPPAAPTGLAIFPADDTGGPSVTTVHQPRLTGQATPGLLVQVFDQNQRMIGSAIVGSNGTFTITPVSVLATGSYTFKAVAIDSKGNYGATGAPLTVSIIPPVAPTGLAIYAADDTGGPGVTAIHQPRITGQATPGQLVQIYNQNQQLVASTIAGSNGTFVATPMMALAPGQYSFVAVTIDQYGNFGTASAALSVTITPPPAAPTGLALYSPDQTGGPGVTNLAQPRLTGKTQAGLLVQIFDSSNNFIGSAFADSTGTFIIIPVAKFSVGTHVLKAAAIDAGGNYSVASANFTLTVTM